MIKCQYCGKEFLKGAKMHEKYCKQNPENIKSQSSSIGRQPAGTLPDVKTGMTETTAKRDTHDIFRAGKRQFNQCSMEKTLVLDAGGDGSSVIPIKGESEGHAGSNPAQPILTSSNDPAGLFLESITLPQKSPINHTPAVDIHQYNLHTANNCNNCKNMDMGKCKVHGYQMPYHEIDCEQWEYRGKKI